MEDSKIDIFAKNESKLDNTINDHEDCITGFKNAQKDRLINLELYLVGDMNTHILPGGNSHSLLSVFEIYGSNLLISWVTNYSLILARNFSVNL